jgi:hypothetical protein
MNCCSYVENPFPFLGALVLPVEILKVPSVGINATGNPFMEPLFVIALLGYYEATSLLNMQILKFKDLLKDSSLD